MLQQVLAARSMTSDPAAIASPVAPEREPKGHRYRSVYTFLALGVVVLHCLFAVGSSRTIGGTRFFCLLDDPMISMNYAKNLATGNGLVWTVGENPPVEGFTNPLWTLWMAVVHLLPLPPSKMSLALMLSGSVVLLCDLFVLAAIARREHGRNGSIPVIIFFLVGTCFPLLYWTLGGFEVGLVTLLFDAVLLLAVAAGGARRLAAASMLVLLIPLVRIDALVPATIAAMAVVLGTVPERRVSCAMTLLGALLLSMALQTAFRLVYYGDWLPNTYYLKMTGVPTALRLEKGLGYFLRRFPQLLIPVVLAAVELAACWKHRSLSPAKLGFGLLALSQFVYTIYVGGDAWEEEPFPNRFLSSALPGLIYLAAFGAFRVASLIPRRWVPGLRATEGPQVAFVTAFLFLALVFPLPGRLEACGHAFDVAHAGIRRALVLRAATGKDATVLVTGAGALPYFLDRHTFDFLGKCDRVIAHGPMALKDYYRPGHSKWDYTHSVGTLRPDVIAQTHHDPRPWLGYLRDQGYTMGPNGVFARLPNGNVRSDLIWLDPMIDDELLVSLEVLERRGDPAR